MSRKGQVTIFIIIALVIVVSIILFFVFRANREPEISGQVGASPEGFLDACLKADVVDSVNEISLSGGYFNPDETVNIEFQFNNEPYRKVAYLCYASSHYRPCINQRPGLLQHIEKELYQNLSIKIRECFRDLEESLSDEGYVVDVAYHKENLSVARRGIEITVDADMTLTRSGEVKKEEEFKITIPSKLQDTVFLVQEIVSQEARFCNFNELGYMLLNPEWSIRPPKLLDDGTRIYSLENRKTKEEFRFAVRGCLS